jgi:hypothetical protein
MALLIRCTPRSGWPASANARPTSAAAMSRSQSLSSAAASACLPSPVSARARLSAVRAELSPSFIASSNEVAAEAKRPASRYAEPRIAR